MEVGVVVFPFSIPAVLIIILYYNITSLCTIKTHLCSDSLCHGGVEADDVRLFLEEEGGHVNHVGHDAHTRAALPAVTPANTLDVCQSLARHLR